MLNLHTKKRQLQMNVQEIRSMFPSLAQSVYGRPLVYFDNAATSQRPEAVVSKWESLVHGSNANIHRAVHKLAADATEEYESTRDAVKRFINASDRREVVFTSGTTEGINLVAFSFGEAFVHEGDEIIVSEEEHHSNIVPWQMLCQATLKLSGSGLSLPTGPNLSLLPRFQTSLGSRIL